MILHKEWFHNEHISNNKNDFTSKLYEKITCNSAIEIII